MKIILLILSTALVLSCSKQREPVEVQNAKDSFSVEFIFEKDGVKVYRFVDVGYYRYFTVGNGSFAPQDQVTSGKSKSHWSDGAETR
jgi:hypothetical protein